MVLLSVFSVPAFAADVDADDQINKTTPMTTATTEGIEDYIIEEAIHDVNVKMSKNHREDTVTNNHYIYCKYNGSDLVVASFDASEDTFTFYNSIEKLSGADRSKIVNIFIQSLSKSEADENLVQSFLGVLSDGDNALSADLLSATFAYVQGDMFYAFKFMEPFLEVMNKILGVAAVLLILILLASTCLDLAYIGLPIFRENVESKSDGKGSSYHIPISHEARTSVQMTEQATDGVYKNTYLIYFRRRALSYILLAICIMYLITGGLGNIIGFVLNLVSGITG